MSPATAAVTDSVNVDWAADADSPQSFNTASPTTEIPARRRGVSRRNDALGAGGQDFELAVPAQEPPPAAPVRRPRVVLRNAEARSRALHQFEGTVLEIMEEEFVARTHDLTSPGYADEQVTLPLDDVPPGDRELLKVGAVFYWLIGYEENDEGARKRTSVLRFRRLPAWSGRAVARVNATAADLMRRCGAR